MQTIILASGSPRRKQLLEWAEVPFEVMVSDADESFPDNMNPKEAPEYIARNKAMAVLSKVGHDRLVLAADTVVLLGNDIIGKPADRDEAVGFLMRLSGKTHEVITGVSVWYNGKEHSFSDTTSVTFHPFNAQEAAYYVDRYKPYDKAGAYAIQEWIGVIGIQKIDGDFYNVMGLPVSRVVQTLGQILSTSKV
jgi:septum formation protein